LENDYKFILKASSKAQESVDYILNPKVEEEMPEEVEEMIDRMVVDKG
jgi:hypothetical protein